MRLRNGYNGPWFVLRPLPVKVRGNEVGSAWTRAGAIRVARRAETGIYQPDYIAIVSLHNDPERHWQVSFSFYN